MSAPKYREFYNMMVKSNADDFKAFKQVHDDYSQNPKKWQGIQNLQPLYLKNFMPK